MIDAVRLTSRISLVASGWLGLGLSDPHDSHVYLVDGGTDALLVDAGCGLASASVAARVRASLGGRSVSRILLTHAHADHAGGAASLAAELDARVLALPDTARPVAAADEVATGLRAARAAGTYPPHLRPAAVPVEPLVTDHLTVGDLRVDVHPTPGHALGHACFSVRDGGRLALFSGDLVFARGRVAILATHDSDLSALATSLRAMAALPLDVLLPGHGAPVLTDASQHLASAVGCLERGALPPGLTS